jgi:uracil-DNA glycosylase family 4
LAQILIKRDSEIGGDTQRSQLFDKIKTCEMCKDLVASRSQAVTGYGDFNADIFIIGEAPGRLGADITGVPFTKDRSGVFLQKMLCMVGLNEDNPESVQPKLKGVYITNIVKCNPRKEDGTNRSPTNVEISNCMNHLEKELEIVKPRIVLTLGLPCSKLILGKDFDGKDFGKMKKTDNFLVLPLWHPAFIIRGGGIQKMNEKKYIKYFQQIKKMIP